MNKIMQIYGLTISSTFVISPQGSQTLMRIKGTTTNYYIYGAGLLYEIDETPTTTNVAFYHFDCRGSTVATGSGKTTLLRNLILQHIALGHGVGVIDPHGDLAEELLNHITGARADHLVYFNPGDLEFPIGLNVIGNVTPDDRHLAASGIVSAFKAIWRDSWGPRLEYVLYNAVSALLECRNQTLLGVNRLLIDDEYRAKVIRQVKDPFIRAFWAEEYENYDERFKREAIAPIQNKIGQFLLNPVIRNILGQIKKKVDIAAGLNSVDWLGNPVSSSSSGKTH